MKIVEIETILVDRYLFVKVHTDEGITGLGESGAWGYLEASGSAVETDRTDRREALAGSALSIIGNTFIAGLTSGGPLLWAP